MKNCLVLSSVFGLAILASPLATHAQPISYHSPDNTLTRTQLRAHKRNQKIEKRIAKAQARRDKLLSVVVEPLDNTATNVFSALGWTTLAGAVGFNIWWWIRGGHAIDQTLQEPDHRCGGGLALSFCLDMSAQTRGVLLGIGYGLITVVSLLPSLASFLVTRRLGKRRARQKKRIKKLEKRIERLRLRLTPLASNGRRPDGLMLGAQMVF